MNEEELQVLTDSLGDEGVQRAQIPAGPTLAPPQEIELSPEILRQAPVINRVRPELSRRSGGTSVWENPAFQEALITFGQAFANAGNYTGQTNPIDVIGNAGRGIIRSNANQAALEAFERGEDIAAAGGQFADPELVASLQERAQVREQFASRLGLSIEEFNQRKLEFEQTMQDAINRTELTREQMREDILLRQAALNLDRDAFEERKAQIQKQFELDNRLADSRIAYEQALIDSSDKDKENYLLRSNELLEILAEQEVLLNRELSALNTTLAGISDNFEISEDGTIGYNVTLWDEIVSPRAYFNASKFARRKLDSPEGQKYKETIEAKKAIEERLRNTRNEIEAVKAAQVQRLTGGQSSSSASQASTAEGSEISDGAQPQGTIEAPVRVSNLPELNALPPGSYGFLAITGKTYRINEDGTKSEVAGND